MKVDPIGVEKLRFYDWFYSCDHKNWYYYRPRIKSDFDPTNLDNTLDKNIKKLNKLLTKNGFKTMPSCEGHKRSDEFVKKAYNNLLSDANKIRTTGLWLINCENDNLHFLFDPNWKLPFTFEKFKAEIGSNSIVRGYIGFETKDKELIQNCIDILNNLGGIDCRFNKGVLEILNSSPNDKERKDNWKAIYNILEDII